jgi:hypothetical protein
VGAVEAADHPEITIDLFFGDEPGHMIERGLTFLQDGDGASLAVAVLERGERRFDAGGDLPAIAGAAPEARGFRIDNDRLQSRARGLHRRMQAGIS